MWLRRNLSRRGFTNRLMTWQALSMRPYSAMEQLPAEGGGASAGFKMGAGPWGGNRHIARQVIRRTVYLRLLR
jgi:hypothetical protein